MSQNRHSVALDVLRVRAFELLADGVLIPVSTYVVAPTRTYVLVPLRDAAAGFYDSVALPAGRGVRRFALVPAADLVRGTWRHVVRPAGSAARRLVLLPAGRAARFVVRDVFFRRLAQPMARLAMEGLLRPTLRGARYLARDVVYRGLLEPAGRGARYLLRDLVYRGLLTPAGRAARYLLRDLVYRGLLTPAGRALLDHALRPAGRAARYLARDLVYRGLVEPAGRGARYLARDLVYRGLVEPAGRAVAAPAARVVRALLDTEAHWARLEWLMRGCRPVALAELQRQLLVAASTARVMRAADVLQGQQALLAACAALDERDPEFVLQLAVYLRRELHLRTVSNLLLARASLTEASRPFVRDYAPVVLCLPGDVCETAALASALRGRAPARALIPACMRGVVAAKLAEFSTHQLAKHGAKASHGVSLKTVVRAAHVSKPALVAMSILGKKYPATEAAFAESSLAAEGLAWEPERAGRRMRLAPPNTWETRLSRGGDRAEAWTQLLLDDAVPYMALLRNVRNVLRLGARLPERVLQLLLARLADPERVQGCRVQPTQFMTAGFSLGAAALAAEDVARAQRAVARARKRGRKRGAHAQPEAVRVEFTDDDDDEFTDDVPAAEEDDESHVRPADALRVRAALDRALRLSATLNCQPLPGRTVVVVDLRPAMVAAPCRFSSPAGTLANTCAGAAVLLSTLLRYAAEDCEVLTWGWRGLQPLTACLAGGPAPESLFDELERLAASNPEMLAAHPYGPDPRDRELFLYPLLEGWIGEERHVDRLVLLSHCSLALHELHAAGGGGSLAAQVSGRTVARTVQRYRAEVAPGFRLMTVNVQGSDAGVLDLLAGSSARRAEDVYVAGLTDRIFAQLAEGDAAPASSSSSSTSASAAEGSVEQQIEAVVAAAKRHLAARVRRAAAVADPQAEEAAPLLGAPEP